MILQDSNLVDTEVVRNSFLGRQASFNACNSILLLWPFDSHAKRGQCSKAPAFVMQWIDTSLLLEAHGSRSLQFQAEVPEADGFRNPPALDPEVD